MAHLTPRDAIPGARRRVAKPRRVHLRHWLRAHQWPIIGLV